MELLNQAFPGGVAGPNHQAGADQSITAEDNAVFEAALRAAGVEHELHTFEGAPHSFFDRKQEQFAGASDDAWAKVLAFIAAHS